MIITNKKMFDEICKLIHSMCKWNKKYEFRLPCDKKSTITFHNDGKVTFLFDVDFELKATYSDVAVNDNFFDDSQLDIIGGTYFLNGIYPLLKIEKKFVYEEYDNGNSAIKTKNFIVFLPKIQ